MTSLSPFTSHLSLAVPSGSIIRILSEDVANKIAAGEVVERPASVVKELLENAIDAGATRIDVTVTAGGRRLISVSDNGCGMGRDDAMLAPERQATSKLRTADDLARIGTMGFRGEALPSIASVSRFLLRTRRAEDEAGTELEIQGGRLVDVRDCGAPPGTTVEVRDLFYNVPARRSFLRSYNTEQAHVRTQFLVHAIAWPALAMTLTCDGDPVHRLRPAASLRERLSDLFGAGTMDQFVPIAHDAGSIRVRGWAGLPSNTRSDTAGQYVFVNGRPSTAPVVQAAVRESYPHLPAGRRPVLFLFLDLPPEEVDVNVHPTKREVRFRAVGAVRDAVLAALAKALREVPGAGRPAPADDLGGFGAPPEPASAEAAVPEALPPAPRQTAFAPVDDRTFAPRGPFAPAAAAAFSLPAAASGGAAPPRRKRRAPPTARPRRRRRRGRSSASSGACRRATRCWRRRAATPSSIPPPRTSASSTSGCSRPSRPRRSPPRRPCCCRRPSSFRRSTRSASAPCCRFSPRWGSRSRTSGATASWSARCPRCFPARPRRPCWRKPHGRSSRPARARAAPGGARSSSPPPPAGRPCARAGRSTNGSWCRS